MSLTSMPKPWSIPTEICSQLYIGDYFGDTLHFTSREHAAFGMLLLHIWLNASVPRRWSFAAAAGLSRREWHIVRKTVLPLFKTAAASIGKWKNAIHAYDGQRLPHAEWYIVKTIILARDGHACTYCGSTNRLHVDHIIPVCRGGSNAFDNLTTSCGPCNQSKGPKLLNEWASAAR